jgi:hypothetical protein
MKKIIVSASLIIAIMLQSCALVFSGRKDKIKVKGEMPTTASVYYNGKLAGTGNCTVKVHKKSIDNAIIEVKADGYETQEFRFSRKIKLLALIGDCMGGFVGLLFDFGSGAIYKAYPQKIHYNLRPLNNAIQNDFKAGDKVIFTFEKYKNEEGEIKTVYPNRAIIIYKNKEIEVPLINVAKK